MPPNPILTRGDTLSPPSTTSPPNFQTLRRPCYLTREQLIYNGEGPLNEECNITSVATSCMPLKRRACKNRINDVLLGDRAWEQLRFETSKERREKNESRCMPFWHFLAHRPVLMRFLVFSKLYSWIFGLFSLKVLPWRPTKVPSESGPSQLMEW